MNILLISPISSEFEDIIVAVKTAIDKTGNTLKLIEDAIARNNSTVTDLIYKFIAESDLVIVDISTANPNVMYELGIAQASQKPIILISQKDLDTYAFDIRANRTLLYDRQKLQETLSKPLRNTLAHSNINELIQKEIVEPQKQRAKAKTIFISYSHVDTAYLERLKIHLKPFEKRGLIDVWVDSKIKAGERWKDKIMNALDKSAIAILLISADFLASDFIIDNELPPILKAEEEKGKIILPIIVKPCRFTKDSNLSKFQAINDPKYPLSKMDDNEREETYVKISDFIDSIL